MTHSPGTVWPTCAQRRPRPKTQIISFVFCVINDSSDPKSFISFPYQSIVHITYNLYTL